MVGDYAIAAARAAAYGSCAGKDRVVSVYGLAAYRLGDEVVESYATPARAKGGAAGHERLTHCDFAYRGGCSAADTPTNAPGGP